LVSGLGSAKDGAMRKDNMNAIDSFLSHLESIFSVTIDDVREIIATFHLEMSSGLAGRKSSLKMIPSFVGPPGGKEKGRYLSLDLGGTNIRVLAVELDGKGHTTVSAVSRFVIPEEKMCGTGDELFDYITDCIQVFYDQHCVGGQRTYDLAFTFSFPVEQRSLVSGKLIGWTKKFTASGVVGKDVVVLLSAALRRKGLRFINVVALANDTVGTLVAKCYADPSCDMGVILGTGTNACYREKAARILKSPALAPVGEMIINIEWGGFRHLKMNIYDRDLDCASPNANKQQLEKLVSGMYLGEIARRVIVDMMTQGLLFRGVSPSAFSEEYMLHTEHLSLAARGYDFFAAFGLRDVSEGDRRTIREIGRIISTRSAKIAGAAIAAVVAWMDANIESGHTIAIDGALFEKYPGYQEQLAGILRELFGERAKRIKLALVRDGSGIGSAIIGAIAVSGRPSGSRPDAAGRQRS
jgi:hexokinase